MCQKDGYPDSWIIFPALSQALHVGPHNSHMRSSTSHSLLVPLFHFHLSSHLFDWQLCRTRAASYNKSIQDHRCVSRHNCSTTENMKAELSYSARLSTALGLWGPRSTVRTCRGQNSWWVRLLIWMSKGKWQHTLQSLHWLKKKQTTNTWHILLWIKDRQCSNWNDLINTRGWSREWSSFPMSKKDFCFQLPKKGGRKISCTRKED